jgi:hypothetical protein
VQNALAVFGAWFVVLWYFVVLVPGLSSSGLSFGAWFVVLWFLSELTTKGKNLIDLIPFGLADQNELDLEEPDGDAG